MLEHYIYKTKIVHERCWDGLKDVFAKRSAFVAVEIFESSNKTGFCSYDMVVFKMVEQKLRYKKIDTCLEVLTLLSSLNSS